MEKCNSSLDKIREELKRYNMIIDQDAISVEEVWCEHGYYVRFSDIKDILKSRDEEIAELHESCNNYKKMYVDKMEEIKKLRDLLDRALPEIKIYIGSIKRHNGFTLYSEIVKVLKESE